MLPLLPLTLDAGGGRPTSYRAQRTSLYSNGPRDPLQEYYSRFLVKPSVPAPGGGLDTAGGICEDRPSPIRQDPSGRPWA